MNKLFMFCVATIMLASCNQPNNATDKNAKDSFLLTGKLTGQGNSAVFLVHRTEEGTIIDSTVAKQDSFSFTGNCPLPRIYVLQWLNNGAKKRSEIFIENATIHVAGSADSANRIVVDGSATQKDYAAYLAVVKPLENKMDSMDAEANTLNEQKDKDKLDAIEIAYDVVNDQKKELAETYISQNRKSHASAYITLMNFATESATAGKLDSVFQLLDTTVQNGYYGKQINELILALKQTEIGAPAPAFTMKDTSGVAVSLSAYKGKILLLDFWASWCGPCRHENPNVVKAYKKFHPKGLEIVGISLDEKHDKWTTAIIKDNLSWQHVSDLKGWSNAVAKQYAVRSIPANFLLDKNGTIIAKDLRGDKLEEKLAEVLKPL